MSEVTQADYDIAKLANVQWGDAINGPGVGALSAALSRIATEQRVVDGIVAWLRGARDNHRNVAVYKGDAAFRYDAIADAIQRGEWKEG